MQNTMKRSIRRPGEQKGKDKEFGRKDAIQVGQSRREEEKTKDSGEQEGKIQNQAMQIQLQAFNTGDTTPGFARRDSQLQAASPGVNYTFRRRHQAAPDGFYGMGIFFYIVCFLECDNTLSSMQGLSFIKE